MSALETHALMDAPLFVRRNRLGRTYRGLPMLAAPGVHEFLAGWLYANRPTEYPVLEVGAGTGALTARLMDRNFEVVPVDSEPGPFTSCCPAFVQVDYNAPDWTAALPDPVFETVVGAEIIGQVENPKKLIRDLHSVCAPGGEVVLTTPNILGADSLLSFVRRGTFTGFDPAAGDTDGQISPLPWWLIEDFGYEAGFVEADVLFIGDLDRPRLQKLLLQTADGMLRRLRREPEPVSGFGNTVMMRLVKDAG